jgi:hypothetical protein
VKVGRLERVRNRESGRNGLSQYVIIVRPEPPGQFTAQVMGIPDIRVVAADEGQAIEQAKSRLTEWLSSARLIPVRTNSAPIVNGAGKPIGQVDPRHPLEVAYLEELARMKREDLERTTKEYCEECPATSSTPTI